MTLRHGIVDYKRIVAPAGSSWPANLLAYYRCENANDSYGTNHFNTSNITYDTGKNNNAAYFNSSHLVTSAIPNFGNEGSISLWLYKDANADQQVIDGNTGTFTHALNLQIYSTNLYFATQPFSGWVISSNSVNTSAWNHIVVTWNGTSKKIYLNNTVSSGTVNPNTFDQDYLIFGRYSNGDAPLVGRMDEIAFWSVDIGASNVSNLYNSGNGTFY